MVSTSSIVGGLAFGATHEIVGAGDDAAAAAVSSTFAAGIAARTTGQIIWCLSKADVFAPALQQAGLDLNRVIFVESKTNEEVLDCCEEALRYRGLGAVIAEVGRFSMIASRQLQLPAEKSGTIGLIVRRWRRLADAKEFNQPTASVTRWRVSPRPSELLQVQGAGRPRCWLKPVSAKSGNTFELEVGVCDDGGRMASTEPTYETSSGYGEMRSYQCAVGSLTSIEQLESFGCLLRMRARRRDFDL